MRGNVPLNEFRKDIPIYVPDYDKKRLEKILEENINPAVASHGGMIQFHDFDMESGIASVLLQGGCSGCARYRMKHH